MKVCYTALLGNYEELKEPRILTPGWEYICYTDQPITSKAWKIINTPVPEFTDNQRYARYIKIMGFVDWEQSIWVDASFCVNVNLNDWWERHHRKPFAAAKHPMRSDFYDECMDCIISGRGDRAEVDKQMNEYVAAGVPRNNGVVQSGILLRNNSEECISLCELWWAEMQGRSTRDQIAFCRVSADCQILHTYIWDYRRSMEFIYSHHFNKR